MFEYRYKNETIDLLKIHLFSMYSSPFSIVNIIFTFSMLAVQFRFWSTSEIALKIILFILMMFFPVFQPLLLYSRYKKVSKKFDYYIDIIFNDKGFDINYEKLQSNHYDWNEVSSVIKRFGVMSLKTKDNREHAFTYKVFKDKNERNDLYSFINSKI